MGYNFKQSVNKYIPLALFCVVAVMLGSCKTPTPNKPAGFSTTPYVYPDALPDYVPPVQLYIPADNPETVEGVALGRDLFYDSILSSDYHHACASCHHQAYAFTDRGKPLSFGVNDSIGTFNSMALFNIPWERGGFFWNARAPILDSQIVGPVPNTKEMNLPWSQAVARLQASNMYPGLFNKAFGTTTITKELAVKAIAQFLRTIISYNSKFDSVQQGLAHFDSLESAGYQLFTTDPVASTDPTNHKVALGHRLPGTGIDCFHCHAVPDFIPELIIPSNQVLMNDGFGTINLKVPSLRNLKFSTPYMSDGGSPNLDSVIAHYDHEVDPKSPYVSNLMYAKKYTGSQAGPTQLPTPHMELSPGEKAGLIAFLNTLNDYRLITNPAYSNPFH